NRHIEATIESAHPDCITLSTPFQEFAQAGTLGRWWPILCDPILHGLAVMLRLSIHDWRGPPEGPAAAGGTIVLFGLIDKPALVVSGASRLSPSHAAAHRRGRSGLARFSGEASHLHRLGHLLPVQLPLGGNLAGPASGELLPEDEISAPTRL